MNSKKISTPSVLLDNSDVKIGPLHYLAVTLWLGWICFYPLSLILTPLFILALPIVLISAMFTIDRKRQPRLGKAIGNWLIKTSSEYLGLKVCAVNKEAIDIAGPSVFVIEPHDVLPLGISIFHGSLGLWPTHKILAAVSSAIFAVPLMRHVFTWCDAIDVSKKSITSSLQRGYSVAVCPGGAQEAAYMENDKEIVLYLKSRFGLVKLCMENGTPLIPSFCFGQRKIFDYWVPPFKPLQSFCRQYGYVPVLFFGYFGLPFGPPKPTPLTVVVGEPIQMPKVENPTNEQLAEYHEKLLNAMSDIFENNKEAHGMGDCTLRII